MENKNQLAHLMDLSIKKNKEGAINGNVVICTQSRKEFVSEARQG